MSAGVSPMMTTSEPAGTRPKSGAARRAAIGGQIGAVRGVGAVGADPEPRGVDAARPELERGAFGNVAGEQAEHDARLRLQPVEQRRHARHEGRPRAWGARAPVPACAT